MNYLITLIIIALIFKMLESKLKNKNKERNNNIKDNVNIPLPYLKVESFFTDNEKTFFNILYNISNKYNTLLFSKVRLADLIYIKNITKNNIKYWNKIKSKHIDFVICNPNNFNILFVIELDDSTHNAKSRKERDEFVDEALNFVSIPIFHIQVSNNYNIDYVEELFKTFTNKSNIIESRL